MKNTKQCPKCGSNDIIFVSGFEGEHGSGNNIPARFLKQAVMVNRYICRSCDYSEEWINPEDIENINKKYIKL